MSIRCLLFLSNEYSKEKCSIHFLAFSTAFLGDSYPCKHRAKTLVSFKCEMCCRLMFKKNRKIVSNCNITTTAMKARRTVFLQLSEIEFYTPVLSYHIGEKNLSKTKACYKRKAKKGVNRTWQ